MNSPVDKKVLLLVEDEMMIAKAQKTALEKYGYTVISADSGQAALDLFSTLDPIDLVLMDIHLGEGMDGIETAKLILRHREVPIVFLSNHTESEIVKKTEQVTSYGYVVKNSKITVLDASLRMAFKLFEANTKIRIREELFRESEERYRLIFNNSPFGLVSFDERGLIVACNGNFAEIVGSSQEKLIGYNMLSLPDEQFVTSVRKALDGITGKYEDRYLSVSSNKATEVRIIFAPMDIGDGRIHGGVGIIEDITERKNAENKLRESEERYKRITAGLNDYLYTVKVNAGRPVETIHNEACSTITGYSIEDFACDPYLWINMVVPEERDQVAGRFDKILQGNDLPTLEHRIICKDGSLRWISDTCIPKYDSGGTLVSYDGVIKDITARKQAEEKIKSLLAEKELILKEVHHRIKNNMNTINSLLNLQAGSVRDPAAVTALEDAGRRVRSMMLLYDKLYRSDYFSEMSTAQYLPPLIDEILVNFPNCRTVSVEKEIEDFVLDVKKLQSIGIIVNELLTNVMKYAFIGKSGGLIRVSSYLKNGQVSIIIEDNGNGMPESVDFEHSTGFGLMLVGVLSKQLRGNLRIERGNGTKIILEFER
jgi:PAS domain S-box-containing protein